MNKKTLLKSINAIPFALKERECGQQERDKNQNHTKKNGNELRTTTRHVTSVINTNSIMNKMS